MMNREFQFTVKVGCQVLSWGFGGSWNLSGTGIFWPSGEPIFSWLILRMLWFWIYPQTGHTLQKLGMRPSVLDIIIEPRNGGGKDSGRCNAQQKINSFFGPFLNSRCPLGTFYRKDALKGQEGAVYAKLTMNQFFIYF